MFNKSLFFQKSEHNVRRFNSTLRWLLVSVLIGIVVGLISGSFGYLLQAVTAFRLSHAYLLFGLPFGAMAIVGSIEDSLNHDYTILFTKAVMDGVLSIVFAASLGIGAAFSMFPVGIYQGSITLLAGLVKPYLTDLMIGRLSCIGSILIFALGLNLTIGTKIKIANLLPAVFLPVIVCLLGF